MIALQSDNSESELQTMSADVNTLAIYQVSKAKTLIKICQSVSPLVNHQRRAIPMTKISGYTFLDTKSEAENITIA